MTKFKVSVIQINSRDNQTENIEKMSELIDYAIQDGAKVIAMPETVHYIGKNIIETAEQIENSDIIHIAKKKAKENGVFIHCGSIYEKNEYEKPYNTTVMIGPDGNVLCKYSKLHMFDVNVSESLSHKESNRVNQGQELTVLKTDLATFGFSICYDIRFPEIFRLMTLNGAEIIFAAGCFALNTGKDHWEPLLRARAIENECYIIAPNQIGKKSSFEAYGKSMIIDPWGNVIAKASDKECVITAEIDLDYLYSIRKQIPVLDNRRNDMYSISGKVNKINL